VEVKAAVQAGAAAALPGWRSGRGFPAAGLLGVGPSELPGGEQNQLV